MTEKLAKKLAELPKKPGVYMFKDQAGIFLYVGKAINLKNRVSSYFRQEAHGRGLRIENMIAQINDLDYVICDNELEALVLENNFIKQIQPKYNVNLRDDKNYIFLKINLKDEIPTIDYERKPSDKNAKYFGPYTSTQSIKETLRLVRKIFPYCAASKVGPKPCFYYHIGKCPGVCAGIISLEEYRTRYIKNIIKFLQGCQTEVLKDLQQQMKTFAARREFEKAARVRNQIYALNRVLERQKLVYPKRVDQDVFSLHQDGVASINLFIVREGKLIQKENFIIDNAKQASPKEIFEGFLSRYYLEATNLPKEILLPIAIDETELRPVLGRAKILIPTKGSKLDLIKLGEKNAKQYLETTTDKHLLEEARLMGSLKELQRVLNLEALPGRIEAFDISNIQGTNAVGSMVVFDYARPKKQDYRKFKINTKQTPDDFAMMSEMLDRRFKRSLLPDVAKWPLPNLILIDGGKGQLSTAVRVLKHYKLNLPIIGLAKRLEEIFLPGQKAPIILPPNSAALFLLQRVRDEAHRFAITYHRKLRSKKSLTSVLDSISGIGPNKKRQLLEKFGSSHQIRKASLTDLAAIVGSGAAEKIKASL